ncbi:helix-turn-helix transcriptional regulator [Brevibacillus invocatus]|uniref:helix-turn-helix transcriptional regulator n=1 Tax=Brevibacillus invocatus TaxID=173959 RepID=UPI00203D9118|nr:YafY family protein [Brevibacillus invocatus]MCM3080693.1 YafY family transcriptional regulator [Brevibacillus invocatus]MCM3430886.1 YafY family transcriptional regulator [Brevibacillus invocatus]
MRADRLLSILLLLQNQGKMTTKQLADKLEVSERTIHRDMEALSAAGVPIFAERGTYGGWQLTDGYQTDLTGLKASEITSLLLGSPSTLLGDLGMREHFEAALQKLLAASPAALRQDAEYVRQRIHIDGAGWHQSNESIPFFPAIQDAVWQEKQLLIQYRRTNDIVERTISPLGLVAKRSTWYLVAEVDGACRTYRISRFLSVLPLDTGFIRPAHFDLARYWEESTAHFLAALPRYPAKLQIREDILDRFAEERFVQIKNSQSACNGWVVADVQFETLESAVEIVLRYGALLKAVEPQELRDQVIAEARAILSLYS